jgi:hypothetical protein
VSVLKPVSWLIGACLELCPFIGSFVIGTKYSSSALTVAIAIFCNALRVYISNYFHQTSQTMAPDGSDDLCKPWELD